MVVVVIVVVVVGSVVVVVVVVVIGSVVVVVLVVVVDVVVVMVGGGAARSLILSQKRVIQCPCCRQWISNLSVPEAAIGTKSIVVVVQNLPRFVGTYVLIGTPA